jgi:hypothetical protein
MAVVTEDWSKRTFVAGESAQRTFLVTGALDEIEAAAAVPVLSGSSHPLDVMLLAGEPEVRTMAPGTYEVAVAYQSNELDGGSSSAVDTAMRFQWDFGEVSEEVEIDADGNPIVNSAGDPLEPPLVRSLAVVYLTVTRWEHTYEVEKALAYIDHQNSDVITVQGQGVLQPGRMRCVSYRPQQSLKKDTKNFPVEYRFELRANGFDWRVIDAGYNGWHDSSGVKPGKIKTPAGKDAGSPVRLDGQGKPMESAFKVEGSTAVVAPRVFVPGALLERTQHATFIRFRRLPWAPFSGLNIFA